MDKVLVVLNWVKENWQDVLAVYGGLVAICTVVVKLTPTTKDDAVLGKIIKVVDTFSTAFTKSDKAKLKDK